MATNRPSIRRRVGTWWSNNAADTFRSWDFRVGVIAAVATGTAAFVSAALRNGSQQVIIGEVALGIALLAVALTALAILVGLIDEQYLRVLEHAGGVERAVTPYQTVAALGVLTTVVGAAALLVRPIDTWEIRAVLLGLTTGLAAWALVGTLQLVGITAFHGVQRGKLISAIHEAKDQLAQLERHRDAK